MTYNGLESCILNGHSFDNESGTSRGEGCVTDSFDEDDSSCSSSTNAFGSFSSLWTIMKKDDQCQDEWNSPATPLRYNVKEKLDDGSRLSDVEAMKEKFAKLLLGEDITGGTKGVSTALALSNAITNLAASVFGELWKLEPLPEERKVKWQREMDWLLSPTNHMVELVPAKQNGTNGRTLEIMTPKARADVHMNLPALRKLDSMLIETLDSMVDTEFWYAEVGSRAEGRSRSAGQSKRWWLPSPRVPPVGLSDIERKRLLHQGKLIYQVFKAAKSINENVLVEMPIPVPIKDALPKVNEVSLILTIRGPGNAHLQTNLSTVFFTLQKHHSDLFVEIVELIPCLLLQSGKASLGEELYKILTAESMSAEEMITCLNLKSEHSALEAINRVEAADVGHAILEAYSRVLANLAFSILSRIGDILQEDVMSNPNSPVAMSHLVGARIPGISDSPMLEVRHSLIHQLNSTDGKSFNASDVEAHYEEAKISSVSATPSRSRVWCIGREACHSVSAQNSP
ncbi:UNVERIFIED_CONTAM: Rop guanine nucleotide exchange factor 14 [Sesamum radiatum]|uniref:Rop guanine nucleotide exchange factor 14 n=1 Tax=Sesamum radiatum TaxID=300843 RepID=A0AAW2KZE3_SESRA